MQDPRLQPENAAEIDKQIRETTEDDGRNVFDKYQAGEGGKVPTPEETRKRAEARREARRTQTRTSPPFIDGVGMTDPDRFQKRAKLLVADQFNEQAGGELPVTDRDFYVVWFSKTLQHWKALISTDLVKGLYYEVTYNGQKRETYVDTYKKAHNVAIADPQ